MSSTSSMAKTPSHEKIEIDESKTIKVADSEMPPPAVKEEGALIADRYRVLHKLGSGGMSNVYQVRHLHLDKIYALKLLQQISEKSVQRFQQEAKAASLLEHPNIVRVHDFGVTEGQPFMTMDCVEGESLADLIKKGPLAADRLARIFGQICSALAHAHEQGVIHRDLKPSNIIVKTTEGGGEQAIVVDFGIAKILEAANSSDDTVDKHSLTRTGDVFGTPLYMSPEQSQGYNVDARSDIYSLACVMYEAATGSPPFRGDSIYHIIHKQITESPPPFPDHLRKTAEGRRLEAIILKALAKDPSDRHKYMVELSSDLKAVESGEKGLWSELRSFSSIISGRLKATERKNVLTKMSVQISAVLAVFAALAIITLPPEIIKGNAQIQKCKDIVQLEQSMFDFGKRVDVFHTAPLIGHIAELEKLKDKRDMVETKLLNHFIRSIKRTIRVSERKTNQVKETLNGPMNTETLSKLSGIRNTLAQIVLVWGESNTDGTKLVTYAQEKQFKTEQRVEILSLLLLLSLLIAPICEIVIATLLIGSWNSRRKALDEIKRTEGAMDSYSKINRHESA